MARIISDLITMLLLIPPIYLIQISGLYDEIVKYSVYGGYGLIFLLLLVAITLKFTGKTESRLLYRVNFFAMVVSFIPAIGFMVGEVLAAEPVYDFINWNAIPLGFYYILSFTMLLVISHTMSKVPDSSAIVVSFPILIVVLGAKFILTIWDLLFPPKMRELVPYLDVTRDLILNISLALADPNRVEIENALDDLGNTNEQMDELIYGYALRKGVGQSIDVGLTVIVVALGFFAFFTDLGIPPQLVVLLFGSLALAMSTFAGLFGPFYGLARSCKEYSLKRGNYRAAAIYKIIENLFSIPFNVASAGFLFLDLPPVDAESLEDFKNEFHDNLESLTTNIASLLGKDKGGVPKKTQKMIAELLGSSEKSMSKLDFRNLREETAREFALTYFQHEFSWKPWTRKSAVTEFAEKYHFDRQLGEENLMLIGDKIRLGQLEEDMVNNIMVSAALRGIIMMEQKYQETLADLELGQTCTGLAFGARQFLKDHYIVQTRFQKWLRRIRDFMMGWLAMPIVFAIAMNNYFNRLFDELSNTIADGIFNGSAWELIKFRTSEVIEQVGQLPNKLKREKKEVPEQEEETEKKQRNWELTRKIKRFGAMLWEVLAFPFIVTFKTIRLIYRKNVVDEENPREGFEEAVAHAALVSIYDSLFQNLVMQTQVSSGY